MSQADEVRSRLAKGITTAAQGDDMEDVPEELPSIQPLRDAVQFCQRIILPAYRATDERAQRQHRRHRWITLVASLFGTLAVLFAILQLAAPQLFGSSSNSLGFAEALAVLLALAAVVLGLYAALQPKWLLERHKAERLRLLRFSAIVDPALWGGGAQLEDWKNQLTQSVDEILNLTREELHHWAAADCVPQAARTPPAERLASASPDPLVDYYLRKRLDRQADYFRERAGSNSRWDHYTKALPPLLFFGSVFCALAHFLVHISEIGEKIGAAREGRIEWSVVFTFFAASLPVVGAGLRTIRSAHEFARNTIRYQAKYVVLHALSQRLRGGAEWDEVFRDLSVAEQVLESEHREWLRLMIEAEWFA